MALGQVKDSPAEQVLVRAQPDRQKPPVQFRKFRFKSFGLFGVKQCHFCASRLPTGAAFPRPLPWLLLASSALKELSIQVQLRHSKVREH